jgi:hypothetical protein
VDLVNIYQKELNDVDKPMWKQYAEALDITIKHIKANEIENKLRIPCAYIVKKILLDNDKFEIVDITSLINEFLKYYEDEYDKYMDGFALISDQEHADMCFYDEFIKKHQQ